MKRRSLLLAALLPFLPFSALAHTPYRQWDIFRKRYLQILTSHADYDGDKVGDEWVAVISEKSPLSIFLISPRKTHRRSRWFELQLVEPNRFQNWRLRG